jgi:hypothetical protein
MTTHYAVHPRAVFAAAMLRCGPTLNVELLGWKAPDQTAVSPYNSDIGAAHLAFYVTDLNAATAYLREQPGVQVLESAQAPSGPTQGERSVYFLAPWGLALELMLIPEHLPYEQETSARLFGPEPSWAAR